jgi:hypothetical protein
MWWTMWRALFLRINEGLESGGRRGELSYTMGRITWSVPVHYVVNDLAQTGSLWGG